MPTPFRDDPTSAPSLRARSRARALRKSMTEPERRLWWHLRHRLPTSGTHFRRQVPLDSFVVDFCCLKSRLIIEADGHQHGFDDHEQRDAARTRTLEAKRLSRPPFQQPRRDDLHRRRARHDSRCAWDVAPHPRPLPARGRGARAMTRAAYGWLALAWVGFALLPWYLVDSFSGYPLGPAGSALALGLTGQAWWLLPMLLPLLAATRPLFGASDRESAGRWLAAAGIGRARARGAAGLRDRPQRLERRLAGRPPRVARTAAGRHGFRRGAHLRRLPDAALPRARGARLVPGRRLRGLVDRPRRRADRRLRVLSRHDDPRERRAGRCRRLRARRVPGQVPRSLDLEPRLPHLEPALRRRLEHPVPGDARRHRHDGARPRLRADRHPHGFSASSAPCAS